MFEMVTVTYTTIQFCLRRERDKLSSSFHLMADLLIGQFPVEVTALHVLYFPVTHKAGLSGSKGTSVFFVFCFLTCTMSLIASFALLPAGGTCQSPALPALVRPPAPPLQPSLDIKPFLPFPLDTAAAVNLFPNFNAVSPKVTFAYVTTVVSAWGIRFCWWWFSLLRGLFYFFELMLI